MNAIEISKKTESKRLEDFKKIAENWDNIPDYAKGKLDGTVSALVAVYLNNSGDDKKAG